MQVARNRFRRWATAGAITAALAVAAGAADAHDGKKRWKKHRHHWHRSYVVPYYAPPRVVYRPVVPVYPPAVAYPETAYVPYAPPGVSFNFTVPLR